MACVRTKQGVTGEGGKRLNDLYPCQTQGTMYRDTRVGFDEPRRRAASAICEISAPRRLLNLLPDVPLVSHIGSDPVARQKADTWLLKCLLYPEA
jgi:hypothetical protein